MSGSVEKRIAAAVAACVVLAGGMAGGAQAQEAGWTPAWTLEGLSDPESVAHGSDGRYLYVTNVAGEAEAKDGNGFISRISQAGKMQDKKWVTGLDAPKGAVTSKGRLFVSDIDRIVEIDEETGTIVKRHAVAGAKFLNDLAMLPDRTVLAADSQGSKIYALRGGKVSVWAEDPQLASVNGLLVEQGRVVATTMAGKLVAIDFGSKAVTVLAEGLGQADGVAPAAGGYYVSEWPGRLFKVGADGKSQTLIDSRKDGAYINDILLHRGMLLTPNMKPGKLTAYRPPG